MAAPNGSEAVSAGRKVDMDIETVRRRCLSRGMSSMKCFSQAFRMFDKDFSRSITYEEFRTGLLKYGLDMEEDKLLELFNKFDRDRSGHIDFQEFYHSLSPPLSGRRLQVVKQVFNALDSNKDGYLQVDDLTELFSDRAKRHPKYLTGEWSEQEVIENLLSAFEQPGSVDGIVSLDEFVDYYAAVSACVEEDSYFESHIKACWGVTW